MPVVPGNNSRFLAYLHNALYATRITIRSIKQSIGIQNLDSSYYLNEFAAFPTLAEQRAIAEFLDRETAKIDELIAKKERLIELLDEKRAALITHAVTRGLNPDAPLRDSGIQWLGQIPAHWEVVPLARYWSVTDCKHRTVSFVAEGVPVASIAEVQSIEMDLSSANRTTHGEYLEMISGNRAPQVGDIVFSRNATVGAAAIVATEEPFCLGQDVCLIRSVRENQRFLLFQLRSAIVMRQLDELMIGSTFRRINVAAIKRLLIVRPPRLEQDTIAERCDAVNATIDMLLARVTKAIDNLKEYRAALITAAVTGKIDVRDEVKAAA